MANTVRRPRLCEVCDASYRPTYHQQRTCGRACGSVINARNAAAQPRSSRLHWTRCTECSRWLPRPHQVVCGGACRTMRDRKQAGESYTRRRPSLRRVITCPTCGAQWCRATDGRGRGSRYCSTACRPKAVGDRGKNDRQRARRAGVTYEPINRQRVYERDGWTCGLCGELVDRTVAAPHPRSPSLDHIVPMNPLDKGDHTYANVQCAHFECNWRKGRTGTQQLRLVG